MPNNDRYEYVCVFRRVEGLHRGGMNIFGSHEEEEGKQNHGTESQEELSNFHR